MQQSKKCINCQQLLVRNHNTWVCPHCNTENIEQTQYYIEPADSNDYVLIECPGATLYEPGTNEIIAGVKFHDNDDPTKGFEIVDKPVYAPTHTRYRRIKKEALGKIRRCQGCQDYTVRMRRKEGPDFFIPSPKHPYRKKLKSVSPTSYP